MGFFTQQQQQQTVTLDDENSVTIRKLTFGETQAVLSESTVFDIVGQDATLDFAKNQVAKLVKALVAWDGPGFEGRPVSAENIRALPPEIGRVILQAVEAFNQSLTETEQKN